MRVLMTADAVGGVWTYALELSAALQRHGVNVVLAVMGPAPGEQQCAQARAIPGLQLHWLDAKLEWMPDPWSDVQRAQEWLLELAQRQSVDLVHLNGYAHAAAPWPRPVLIAAHSCVCSWWEAVHGAPAPAEWDAYRRKVAAGVHACHAIVAPTQAFLLDFVGRYAVQTPAAVIHNARAPGPFLCDPRRPREPFILACGRLWDQAKNMRALDEAAPGLQWPIFVAGEPTAPHGARFQAQRLHSLGALPPPALAAWFRRAAVYVHPARYEPFGLSVLEAALAGCALVLADLPTLRELWDGAALFAPVDDAKALQRSLRRLIERPTLRRRLAEQAALRARRYVPERMAARYLAVYEGLQARTPAQEFAVA